MATFEFAFESVETYTLEDFHRFLSRLHPGDVNRYEFIQGKIVMTPPASSAHSRTGSRVCNVLTDFVVRHDLGECYDASGGFELPSGDLVQPDFAFVSKDRFEAAHRSEETFERAVPNLVVEILSRSTAKIDREDKKSMYEKNGVDEYWIVDRARRQITVFQLVKGRYGSGPVYSADQEVTSKVLPGFRYPVSRLIP